MSTIVSAANIGLPASRRGVRKFAVASTDSVRLRRHMERAVERLIAALDELDLETEDLADGGDDEPCLGAPERHPSARNYLREAYVDHACHQLAWDDGRDADEREEVSEDEGACIQSQPHDAESDEHSLGWADNIDQKHISRNLLIDGQISPDDDVFVDVPHPVLVAAKAAAREASAKLAEIEGRVKGRRSNLRPVPHGASWIGWVS